MHSCTTSTNATWNRVITAFVITAIIRYVEPQQSTTFSSTLLQVGKQIINNDKQALPDAIRAVRCWLGFH